MMILEASAPTLGFAMGTAFLAFGTVDEYLARTDAVAPPRAPPR